MEDTQTCIGLVMMKVIFSFIVFDPGEREGEVGAKWGKGGLGGLEYITLLPPFARKPTFGKLLLLLLLLLKFGLV